MKKTLRLVIPQWQGGNNPDYAFGAELLAYIAPSSDSMETLHVPINMEINKKLELENGIEGEAILLNQLQEIYNILDTKKPDKIIVLGGDCSVSQAPFDYLSGKYKDKFGILWLDAHPDVATTDNSSRNHEMVLENLMSGKGSRIAETVRHTINSKKVMFAGLIYNQLRERDQVVNTRHIKYATPTDLMQNNDSILKWIKDNDIQYLAVHWDLDVLSPRDYRSIYPAEPYLDIDSFGAAVGELRLEQIVKILNDVTSCCDIVGLTIAEHLPWDALRLKKVLSEISIFKG